MAAVAALTDVYGYEYLTALGNNDVMIESGSVALEKLNSGECKVIMILEESVLKARKEDGSKIECIYPEDGIILIPSTAMIVDEDKSANMNTEACEAVANWLLSEAGQKLPYDGELKGKVIVGIRPEQIQYVAEGEGDLTGVVKSHFYLGDVDDCRVDLGGGKEVRVIADAYESMGVAHGKKVSLKVRNFHAFPMDESAGDFRKILT